MSPEAARIPGRVCLVTGATSGHGRAVASALAGLGAEVVLLGRDPARCEDTADEIEAASGRRPGVLLCDLASRRDVDRAADAVLSTGRPLHVLVNNAGAVHRDRRVNQEGLELTLAVNYLAAFQLTLRLLERLKASRPARVVNVASDMHRIVSLDPDSLVRESGHSWWRAYSTSKLALVYFTRELARRLRGQGVTANAVDPGPVASRIASHAGGLTGAAAERLIHLLFPSADRAARTAVYLAASPQVARISGCYFKFMKLRTPRVDPDEVATARRLWELSARLTGQETYRG